MTDNDTSHENISLQSIVFAAIDDSPDEDRGPEFLDGIIRRVPSGHERRLLGEALARLCQVDAELVDFLAGGVGYAAKAGQQCAHHSDDLDADEPASLLDEFTARVLQAVREHERHIRRERIRARRSAARTER